MTVRKERSPNAYHKKVDEGTKPYVKPEKENDVIVPAKGLTEKKSLQKDTSLLVFPRCSEEVRTGQSGHQLCGVLPSSLLPAVRGCLMGPRVALAAQTQELKT